MIVEVEKFFKIDVCFFLFVSWFWFWYEGFGFVVVCFDVIFGEIDEDVIVKLFVNWKFVREIGGLCILIFLILIKWLWYDV